MHCWFIYYRTKNSISFVQEALLTSHTGKKRGTSSNTSQYRWTKQHQCNIKLNKRLIFIVLASLWYPGLTVIKLWYPGLTVIFCPDGDILDWRWYPALTVISWPDGDILAWRWYPALTVISCPDSDILPWRWLNFEYEFCTHTGKKTIRK
jgi:hypothetical protein